jgi:hypothetical protein
LRFDAAGERHCRDISPRAVFDALSPFRRCHCHYYFFQFHTPADIIFRWLPLMLMRQRHACRHAAYAMPPPDDAYAATDTPLHAADAFAAADCFHI